MLITAATRQAGKQLGIACPAHLEPHHPEAERLVKSGATERLRHFTSEHGRVLDPSKAHDQWRADKRLAGGDSLDGVGIYALDAACWLMGAGPVSVTAEISNPANGPTASAKRSAPTAAPYLRRNPPARRASEAFARWRIEFPPSAPAH